jgi:uncharacterized membrane protein
MRGTGWRWGAAVFWLMAGSYHFVNPRFYEAIVPPPLDRWKKRVNVAAGAAELIGAAGIVSPQTRPAARWWLLTTLAAVYPANIYMALRAERFPRYPAALLWARLPVQGLFALLTWAGTRAR